MKILIISSSHPFHASGVVAFDLYEGLKSQNNEVRLMTMASGKHENKEIIFVNSYFQNQFGRAVRKIRRTLFKDKSNPDYLFFERDLIRKKYSTKKLLKRVDFVPDAIIVLFMTRFVTFENLHEMQKNTGARIFLYPMDMEPFTGGCHYAWSCRGYTKDCGKCPALYSDNPADQSARNLAFKKRYSQNSRIVPLACNTQTFEQLKASSLFHGQKIYNKLYTLPDERIFKKLVQEECRAYFKLPAGKRVFFFGAVSLAETRKGMGLLLEALQIVSQQLDILNYDKKNLVFLVAGSAQLPVSLDPSLIVQQTGFIKSYDILARAYNAADFFISPSVEETGPTMVLQSIFCETPVISYNVGYSIDLLNDRMRQFVAGENTAQSLSACILRAIKVNEEEHRLCRNEISVIRETLANGSVSREIHRILEEECMNHQ
jgi:glycosyltransferase involved in cell wall biosynthesis